MTNATVVDYKPLLASGKAPKAVIAGIASMPSRMSSLRQVVEAIHVQVDHVYVYLNNFTVVPSFLNLPNVTVLRSQDHGDLRDVGKFFPLTFLNSGYYISIDDDIIYPADYVERLVSALQQCEGKAVVGVHGVLLPRHPRSFFDRKVFTFSKGLQCNVPVSFLGTGTCAFDLDEVSVPFSIFTSYGMADLHVGTHLKAVGVPAVAISRKTGWLREIEPEGEEGTSLYLQTRQLSAPHNILIREGGQWGERDILDRAQVLEQMPLLDDEVKYALEIMQAVHAGKSNFLALPTHLRLASPLLKAALWIAHLADANTQEIVFSKILVARKTQKLRQISISNLVKVSTASALERSRVIIRDEPTNLEAVLQHAELCARAELPSEAIQCFEQALSIMSDAEFSGELPKEEVILKYFVFLTSNGLFEEADRLSAEVECSNFAHPKFDRSMFLLRTFQNRHDEAAACLARFLNYRQRDTRRLRSELIRMMLKSHFQVVPGSVATVGLSCIDSSQDSAHELLDLLKISLMLEDKVAASACWSALLRKHVAFLGQHPEIGLYYSSHLASTSDIFMMAGHDRRDMRKLVPYKVFEEMSVMGKHLDKDEGGPLVSVIMTAYNSEKTISYAIESILNQTHQNIELVVVDDRSSDGTAKVIQGYCEADRRVKLMMTKNNSGPYIARNAALQVCRGEYIAIHDADDAALPDRISIQVAAMQEGIVASIAKHIRYDAESSVRLENDGSIVGHGPMTLMVRKKVIEEIGEFAPVRTRGDKEFECRLEYYYGAHAIRRLPDIVTICFHNSTSNSHTLTRTSALRHDLLLFKEYYTRKYQRGDFTRSNQSLAKELAGVSNRSGSSSLGKRTGFTEPLHGHSGQTTLGRASRRQVVEDLMPPPVSKSEDPVKVGQSSKSQFLSGLFGTLRSRR